VAKPIKAKPAKPKKKDFREVDAEIVEKASSAKKKGPLRSKTRGKFQTKARAEKVESSGQDYEISADDKAVVSADPVARYFAEIRKYPLLTKEQENALAVRYRETGDAKAAEALVTANLRFVVKVAAEYSRFGAKLIDLVQEGNVGLMHAVKEFNPYKGVRLITYAVWWIRGYIQEYLMRQYSMVRIGTTASQKKLFYQLQRERENLEKVGLQLGIAQISGKLGISEDEVSQMHQRLSGRDVSLDQPVGEGSSTLLDLQGESNSVGIDDELGLREQIAQLNEKLELIRPSLSEKELYLLESRLLSDEPLTLQEIGEKYGTTREAVRQMEARLLQKIRELLVNEESN
jgi:RNA polymerase sigma-32 factor